MKYFKLLLLLIGISFLNSCKTKPFVEKPYELYEILKFDEQGGASIRFYEIVSEPNEFKMLLGDKDLKDKIKKDDISTSNFLLLNMGEKSSGGYTFEIEKVEETQESILVTIKEIEPEGMVTTVMTYPMAIVKINSKKKIVFQ
jgi:hypothetical protein